MCLYFLSLSHKTLAGTWEICGIYNLWAESEESILNLKGNVGFREEAGRERARRWLYVQQAVPHFYSEACKTWKFTARTPDL